MEHAALNGAGRPAIPCVTHHNVVRTDADPHPVTQGSKFESR